MANMPDEQSLARVDQIDEMLAMHEEWGTTGTADAFDLEEEKYQLLFGEEKPKPAPIEKEAEPDPEPETLVSPTLGVATDLNSLAEELRPLEDAAVRAKAAHEEALEAVKKLPIGSARQKLALREIEKLDAEWKGLAGDAERFRAVESERVQAAMLRRDLVEKRSVTEWRQTALSAQRMLTAEKTKRQANREPFYEIEVELQKVEKALTEQPSAHFKAQIGKKLDAEIAAHTAQTRADADRIEQAMAAD